jgi:cell division protein ZapA
MSIVEVKVGTRLYQVACEEGQEQNLLKLAGEIDEKVNNLSRQLRTGNDSMLLIMTALMMQDELNEFRKKSNNDNEIQEKIKKITEDKESEMAEIVNSISGFVETLADKL